MALGSNTCATCALYSPNPNGRPSGQCRIAAPFIIHHEDGRLITTWPLVKAEWWCGEHATFEEDGHEEAA